MEHNLQLKGFGAFKVITAFIFLSCFLLFKNFMMWLVIITPPLVGKAHALGAWIAMWKANKLNKKYVAFILLFIAIFTYLGLYVLTMSELGLFTSLLFVIHFIYDEFDLQEETREWVKSISPISTFILIILYYCRAWNLLSIDLTIFLGIFLFITALEFIILKKVTWFTINMKIIQIFLLFFIFNNIETKYFIGTILFWHYFFWFIFPIYKLHKYNRKERDSFIFILLIIVGTSFYYANSQDSQQYINIQDYAIRYFYILTIVHILGTAPFAYFFGLPKPKIYQIQQYN